MLFGGICQKKRGFRDLPERAQDGAISFQPRHDIAAGRQDHPGQHILIVSAAVDSDGGDGGAQTGAVGAGGPV